MNRSIIVLVIFSLLSSCSLPILDIINLTEDSKQIVKIVQISDIHFKQNNETIRNMIKLVNESNPDILVFTGDMIDNSENIESLLLVLSTVNVACPKYAILGNWEYWSKIDIPKLKSSLNDLNITLLVNESSEFIVKGIPIVLYGVDDYLGGTPTFTNFSPSYESKNIILSHCPILFDTLIANKENSDISCLMLSGHTHGGQITAFGIPIILPEGSGKYVAGKYQSNNCTLIVSRGIGNSGVDLRIFSDPSIEVITF